MLIPLAAMLRNGVMERVPLVRVRMSPLRVVMYWVVETPGAVTMSDGTPQDIVTAPGVSTTQYITTRNGDILTLTNGTLSITPFLNMAANGISIYTGGEGGLLG